MSEVSRVRRREAEGLRYPDGGRDSEPPYRRAYEKPRQRSFPKPPHRAVHPERSLCRTERSQAFWNETYDSDRLVDSSPLRDKMIPQQSVAVVTRGAQTPRSSHVSGRPPPSDCEFHRS